MRQRRLRPLARPRPEHPAAPQSAHPGHDDPPRLRRSCRRSARTPTATRPAVSRGKSEYNALILGVRRRLSQRRRLHRRPTRCRAGVSTIGTAADELNTANIQDPNNPFDDPRQFGPNRTTDARHRVTLSATFQLPWRLPRRADLHLPLGAAGGPDRRPRPQPGRRRDDIPATAFRVDRLRPDTGVGDASRIGACETVNCGRGSAQSQMNLRVSKVVPPRRHACASRRSARSSTCSTRSTRATAPTTTNRRVTDPDHGPARPDAAPAELVLGRHPASRTAGRPARIPVLVLTDAGAGSYPLPASSFQLWGAPHGAPLCSLPLPAARFPLLASRSSFRYTVGAFGAPSLASASRCPLPASPLFGPRIAHRASRTAHRAPRTADRGQRDTIHDCIPTWSLT